MRGRPMLIPSVLIAAALSMAMVGGQPGGPAYTADFGIACSDILLPSGDNRYCSLNPGSVTRLAGEDNGQVVEVEITVLQQMRPVHVSVDGGAMTVKTRVVQEREWVDRQLVRVSLRYLACCAKSGNIYNFGEDVSVYEHGVVVGHEDSWKAGENGARPGLFMPGFFLLGSRYQTVVAPGVSMDRAENVGMGLTLHTPAGDFHDCVTVKETTPLEPDEEVLKVYAPGVGLIADGALQLVGFQR